MVLTGLTGGPETQLRARVGASSLEHSGVSPMGRDEGLVKFPKTSNVNAGLLKTGSDRESQPRLVLIFESYGVTLVVPPCHDAGFN